MIFSIYNYAARAYDYYEAPGTSADYGVRGTKYRALSQLPQGPLRGVGDVSIGPIGFAPEALALPLPRNARRVGRGQEARGVVAVAANAERGDSNRREEGSSNYVSGLGDASAPTSPTSSPVVQTSPVSFGHVVVAACIASVVGVAVQKLLAD